MKPWLLICGVLFVTNSMAAQGADYLSYDTLVHYKNSDMSRAIRIAYGLLDASSEDKQNESTISKDTIILIYKALSDIYNYCYAYEAAEIYANKANELFDQEENTFPDSVKSRLALIIYTQLGEVKKEKYWYIKINLGLDSVPGTDSLIHAAIRYYKMADSIYNTNIGLHKIQYLPYKVMTLQNIGEAYYWWSKPYGQGKDTMTLQQERNLDTSGMYLDKALGLADNLQNIVYDPHQQSQLNRLKGYILQNKYYQTDSINFLNQSFEIRAKDSTGHLYEYLTALVVKGRSLFEKGQYQEAEALLNRAITLANKNGGFESLTSRIAEIQLLQMRSEEAARMKNILLRLVILTIVFVMVSIALFVVALALKKEKAGQAKLNRELQQKNLNLAYLNEISLSLLSLKTLDLHKNIEEVYEKIVQLFPGTSTFGISIYDPSTKELINEIALHKGKFYKPYKTAIENKTRLGPRCFETKEGFVMANAAIETPQKFGFQFEDGGRELQDGSISTAAVSLIYVPILDVNNTSEPLGVLTIQSEHETNYSDEHLLLLTNVASTLSLAIQNTNKYQTLEQWSFTFTIALEALRHPVKSLATFGKSLYAKLRDAVPSANKSDIDNLETVHQELVYMFNSIQRWIVEDLNVEQKFVEPTVNLNLYEYIERTFGKERAKALDRGIKIENNIDSQHTVVVQKYPLQLVMHELLSNAIKFSPPDTIISLSSEASGEWVKLTVADLGSGMNAATLACLKDALVLNKMSRLQELPPDKNQGSRTALSICYRILQAINGAFVDIRSQEAVGSSFTFQIPLRHETIYH